MHFKHPEKFMTEKHHNLLERFCDHLLLGIEPRGDHATGFVATTAAGTAVIDKKDLPAHKWLRERKPIPLGARTVLLHTRLATQGSPKVWANNHPVFSGTVFTVHNGTIYNDDSLFKEHELKRLAEVDSEIIPALLDKFTFEHADKAFAELGGGFATASIDPVRYPGVVVLGKGGNWPIVTFDTKDFIVWASTEKAIKDAWGSCLGTPPSKGYVSLNSGEVWFLNNDKIEKKPKAFEHKTYSRTSSWQTGSQQGTTATYADDWEDWDDTYWPMGGNSRRFIANASEPIRPYQRAETRTVLNHEKLLKELRKTGKGTCVTYQDRTTPAGEKYLAKYGNNKWVYCVHCRVSVADVQTVKATRDYGDICIDCLALAKATEKKQNTEVTQFLTDLGMRSDDYAKLEQFTDLQTYIHNQALHALARDTGVKRTMIDWILHRADVTILEMDRSVQNLYCELHDRYSESVAELWQLWAAEEVDEESETPQIDSDPYVTCASGTHRESEADDCESCLSMMCGVEPFQSEEELEAKAVVLYDNEPLEKKKCMVCRRKAKHFLGLTHAWCAQHAMICHARKCESKPVGFAPNNQRFCHSHSRGVTGFLADNDTEARKKARDRATVAA